MQPEIIYTLKLGFFIEYFLASQMMQESRGTMFPLRIFSEIIGNDESGEELK